VKPDIARLNVSCQASGSDTDEAHVVLDAMAQLRQKAFLAALWYFLFLMYGWFQYLGLLIKDCIIAMIKFGSTTKCWRLFSCHLRICFA
jgi:hypothetical protein